MHKDVHVLMASALPWHFYLIMKIVDKMRFITHLDHVIAMGVTKMQPDQAQLASCVTETFKNSKLHK